MSVNILGKEYPIATTIRLDLYGNNLTSLPESIQSLSNLKELNLTNNNLTSLPESIQSLSKLQSLFLANNKLISLPESIGGLYNLQELYVYNNKLTNLPESIKSFTKIKQLYLNESSYDINNLSIDCNILILTSIENNITNLPPLLRTLYLKSDINVDMIKLPYGCDIIRF
jgi:Leucine-rich repeat (LRR) protein